MIYFALAIAVIAIAVIVWVVRGRAQSTDGMSSFQRQIDALSPEARRPVVDQVQRAAKEDPDDETSGERDDD